MKECKIDTPVFLCSEDDVVTGKPHVYSVDCGDGVSNYYLKRMSIMDGFSEFRYTVRLEMVDIKTGGRDYFLLSEATKS